MWKSGAAALLAFAAISPCLAQPADTFDAGMNTLWEVLWHQSGTATRLVRWDKDIQVRVWGTNVAEHRQHALRALGDAAAVAGVKVIDVSDRPDAARLANVSIQITPDTALSEAQPCETRLNFETETHIDSVTMQMREHEEWRCAYHESMHVMGVRGHPEGNTVLSYFAKQVEGLTPLDQAMLRAWYSPRARGGMTPFEMLPILADELVAILPDQQQAVKDRDRFLARTVHEMEAFADGAGDLPMIVKQCGKTTEQGIRFGRMEMSYFLGIAYLDGRSVAKDSTQAVHWLEHAASLGSRSAAAVLGAGRAPSAPGS
jgi:hypothetical protein